MKQLTGKAVRGGGVVSAALGMLLLCCANNPFVPPIGIPLVDASLRQTPLRVIEQLLSAYQNKSITMYEDLFPKDGSFRFYVAPNFLDISEGKAVVTQEVIDARYAYIPAGTYNYWTYSREVETHRQLFRLATSISVVQRPVFDADDFVYHLSEGGDTIGVEVLMVGGEIQIGWRPAADPLIEYWETLYIERQVFVLLRDAQRQWVIGKWFDFGTSG